MKLEEGEIVTLEDQMDYLILKCITHNHDDYVVFTTVNKPIKTEIRKQVIQDSQIILESISDEELKIVLSKLKDLS